MERPAVDWNVKGIEEKVSLAICNCSDELQRDRVFKILTMANAHMRFSLTQPQSWETEDQRACDQHDTKAAALS